MNAVKRLFSGLEQIIGFIGLIGILIITAGVLTRFVFHVSIAWADELLRTLFIYGYFIGAAISLYKGSMMRLELLEDGLSRRKKELPLKIVRTVLDLLNMIFFGILTFSLVKIMIPFFVDGTTTTTSKTPAWVIPMGFALGVAIMTLLAVSGIVKEWLPSQKKADVKS